MTDIRARRVENVEKILSTFLHEATCSDTMCLPRLILCTITQANTQSRHVDRNAQIFIQDSDVVAPICRPQTVRISHKDKDPNIKQWSEHTHPPKPNLGVRHKSTTRHWLLSCGRTQVLVSRLSSCRGIKKQKMSIKMP